jgi:hypothetical protein
MAYSPIEDKYLSALTAFQFPDMPVEPAMPEQTMPGRQDGDMMLAAGPSGTVSDASRGYGEIKPIPRNAVVGGVANFVKSVRDMANQYEVKDWVPLLGSLGVGDLLLGKSPEEIENWAYGNSPITMPPSGTGGYVPIVKTGRKEGLADVAMLGIDVAPIGKGLGTAAKVGLRAGKALTPEVGRAVAKSMDALGTPLQMNIMEDGPSLVQAPVFSRQENAVISAGAGRKKLVKDEATNLAKNLKSNYPEGDGWAPIEIGKVDQKFDKAGKFVKVEVEPKAIAYDFHTPPEGVPEEAWQATMSSRILDEVQTVVDRAAAGDQAALDILAEASWYRAMRDKLRAEFGGLGDVFADVLGTTSAQTDVRQNFKNAVTVLTKFSRGDYDKTLAAYEARVAKGQPVDPETLSALDKAGDFDLIKSDAGKLFNTNSPATMGALLDMFRAIKAGDSPKTPNFTGNLIGLTNEATIDVWAARMLRRLADLPRIPPPAEKGVGGAHQKGSTLFDPKVSGEFGFGQDAFREAADEINKSGIIKNIAPAIGDLGPDDLQAVAWFIEKEKWTNNGWTTKAGEGGSLDYEMSLAGAADQSRISDLRKGINAGFKEPAMRVGEKREMRDSLPTDPNVVGPSLPPFVGPSTYPGRVDQARQIDIANKTAMRDELLQSKASVDRYTLGVSGERPDKPMSNYAQAELAAEFDDVVRDDASVVTYNLANTYGSFMGDTERALNAEFIVRQNFNPSSLERRMVEQGKTYDQDAVFISKVVPDGASPNARPGVEIYFKQKMTPDQMAAVTAKLRQYGVDGFTYVTDMRFNDRINVQARAGGAETAGLNGLRFQYIPEFDDAYSAADQAKIMQQKEDLFQDVVGDIIKEGNVSDARLVFYDTKVYFRGDYDEYLTRTAGQANPTQGGARPAGADVAQPNTSGEVGKDFTRAVSNRLRKKTTSSKSSTVKRGGAAPTSGAE